jgi:hypothetical protein
MPNFYIRDCLPLVDLKQDAALLNGFWTVGMPFSFQQPGDMVSCILNTWYICCVASFHNFLFLELTLVAPVMFWRK